MRSPIIALTETWTKKDSVIPNINGYKSFVSPSVCGKAGGLLIYVSKSLSVSRIMIDEFIDINCDAEFLAIDIKHQDLILLLIYKHPSCNHDIFCESLNSILISREFNRNGKSYCIIGDTNIDILKTNKLSNTYVELLNSYHFIPLITLPTRTVALSESCIDHVFTNATEKTKATILDEKITDHAIIVIDFYNNTKHDVITHTRLHNANNIRKFCDCVSRINWDNLFQNCNCLDDLMGNFCDTLQNVYNNNFPFVTRKTKDIYRVPWMSKNLKYMLQRKKTLLRRHKVNPNAENKCILSTHTKRLKNVLNKSKQQFYKNLLLGSVNSKKWKIINGLRDKSNYVSNSVEYIQGDVILNYFASIFSNPNTTDSSIDTRSFNVNNTIFINPTCKDEVVKFFSSLPNKRSSQQNDLPLFIWKKIAPLLATQIANLINVMIETSHYPTIFKTAEITPVYKKGNPSDPQNYRPIAILHNLSKIFEKILLNRIFSFVNKYNVLCDCQFGFRPNFSTKDAVVSLLLNIEKNFILNKKTCVVFIDLTKAFDMVSHSTLISTFKTYGLRGNFCNLIISYLSGRSFCVKLGNKYTDSKSITRGVPQGSLLGPVFYSLYVNDMSHFLDCQMVQYADDTTLIIPYSSSPELKVKLQLIETQLHNYLKLKSLVLNNNKTCILLFGDTHTHSVNFLNKTIVISKETTFLGIKLDSRLKFNAHVQHICSNIKRSFNRLYFFRDIFDKNTKKMFFNAYISPHILYAIPFILNSNQVVINKLNVIYKSAIKILFRYHRQFPTQTLHDACGIPPLKSFIQLHTSLYTHKIYTKTVPPIICSEFQISTRHNFILHSPTPLTSLFNNLCLLWNSLPSDIRSQPSAYTFKKALKNDG